MTKVSIIILIASGIYCFGCFVFLAIKKIQIRLRIRKDIEDESKKLKSSKEVK